MNPKRSVEELQDYLEKMKAVIDYHIITASSFLKEFEIIEKMIEERKKDEKEKRTS